MEDLCQQFLVELTQVLLGESQEPITDQYLKSAIQYSGNQLNDQGDLAACLRSPSMNFVEAKCLISGVVAFRGMCLKDVCNAQYFTDHIEEVATFLQGMQLPETADSISFTQYPITKPSIDNYGFFIISIILGMIGLLVFASFLIRIYKVIKIKSNLNEKCKFVTLVEENLQEQLISRNYLSNQNNINQFQVSSNQSKNQNQQDIEEQHSYKKEQVKEIQHQSLLFKLLDCWNVKTNLEKILTLTVRNADCLSFDCVRVFSFLQVVLGHQYLMRLSYFQNLQDFEFQEKKSPFILFVFSCFYSVDVFFLLGGFFVAYVTADQKILQHLQIKKFIKMISSFFLAIINRFIRIFPSYFIALYIMWQYANQVGNSPTWSEFEFFTSQCNDNKWKKLLFIDNLLDEENNCFSWSWYLSNDIQMFVGSLLLMIVYANNKKLGKIVILFTLTSFIGLAIYFAFKYELLIISQMATLYNPNQPKFYYKPWTRCPPYILGLVFGILYKEFSIDKQKKQQDSLLSKISHYLKDTLWKWLSYFIGMTIILLLIFGPRPLQINGTDYWNNNFQYFIFGISRVLYAFGIICILLPGVCGSKDLLVRVMSAQIFQFVSKLTFQGYLFHYTFLTYSLWNFKDSLYLNSENIIYLFIAEVLIILTFSFFFVILIELPFNNLANLIFNKSPARQVKVPNEQKQQKEIQKTEIQLQIN